MESPEARHADDGWFKMTPTIITILLCLVVGAICFIFGFVCGGFSANDEISRALDAANTARADADALRARLLESVEREAARISVLLDGTR